MSDEKISNEAVFAQALGLNPDVIVAGSMEIKMKGQHAVLNFEVVMPVSHQRLAAAMMAASGVEEPEVEEQA